MKWKLALATIVCVAPVASQAADLVRKAPVYAPPAPVVTWTGWYAGVNAGVNWSSNNDINVLSSGVFNPSGYNPAIMNQAAIGGTANLSNGGSNAGFIGGGQIGYNWQSNNWVFGFEADIQGLGKNGSSGSATTSVIANNGAPIITNINASSEVDWMGTVRGRVGMLATPGLLIYGTGGLAYGRVSSDFSMTQSHAISNTNGSLSANFSDTRAGWTVGAGFEWLFAPNWTAKVEYLYYDLGDVTYNAGTLNAAFSNGFVRYGISPDVSTSYSGNIVRAGINYKFNWGKSPVVAKY